jgi:hypothetical protein
VKDSFPELIPPDDPRFRGADSLDDDEPYFDPVQSSEHLRGAEWRWSVWKEKPASNYDAHTGEESPAVWDHDHCHFCYETAFSERYDTDLREGWLNWSPTEAREPMEQSAKYPVDPLRQGQPMYDTWVVLTASSASADISNGLSRRHDGDGLAPRTPPESWLAP